MDDNGFTPNPFDEEDNQPVTLPSSGLPESGPVITPDQGDRSRSKVITWLVIIIVIGGCLCLVVPFASSLFDTRLAPLDLFFPTLTPSTTSTPTVTSTPTPNATATQEILQTATAHNFQATATAAAGMWPILSSDTFDANKNSWAVGSIDNEYGKISRDIKDGKYSWDATAHKGVFSWVSVDTVALTDFYYTAQVGEVSGSGSADYGLTFREDPDKNLYYFGITKNQQYSISRNYNNEWSDLVAWTPSSAILSDQPNRLTVIANGDHFVFFINDQFMVEIQDDKLNKGVNGLAIDLALADAHALLEFDNMELRVPKP